MCYLCYKTRKLGGLEADSFGMTDKVGLIEEEINFCHFGIEEVPNIAYLPVFGLPKPFRENRGGGPLQQSLRILYRVVK